jgi:hypothetical protein
LTKDNDSSVERGLGAAEAALPGAVMPPRPEKQMLPKWLLAAWGLDTEANPAATRASVNALFRRGDANTQAREVR